MNPTNSNNDGYVPFVVITNRPILSLLMSYRRIFSDKAMGVTSGTGTSYPSGAHGFLPVYQLGSCCSIFVCGVLSISVCLFVLLLLIVVMSVPNTKVGPKQVQFRPCVFHHISNTDLHSVYLYTLVFYHTYNTDLWFPDCSFVLLYIILIVEFINGKT